MHTLPVCSLLQTWPKKKWQGSSSATTVACARQVLYDTSLALNHCRSLSRVDEETTAHNEWVRKLPFVCVPSLLFHLFPSCLLYPLFSPLHCVVAVFLLCVLCVVVLLCCCVVVLLCCCVVLWCCVVLLCCCVVVLLCCCVVVWLVVYCCVWLWLWLCLRSWCVACVACVVWHAENHRVYIQDVPVKTGTVPTCTKHVRVNTGTY